GSPVRDPRYHVWVAHQRADLLGVVTGRSAGSEHDLKVSGNGDIEHRIVGMLALFFRNVADLAADVFLELRMPRGRRDRQILRYRSAADRKEHFVLGAHLLTSGWV